MTAIATGLERTARVCRQISADIDRERVTLGTLHAAQRRVRDDLTLCQTHPVPTVHRDDVSAILGELCYAVGTYRGHVAIYFAPMSDTQFLEEAMALGAAIQKAEPRMYSGILRSVRWDAKRWVVYFELPVREQEVA